MIGLSRVAGAVIVAGMVSSLAVAETAGTISGTIDAEPVLWDIWAGQSDWNDYGVSIHGRNPDEANAFRLISFGFQKNGNMFEAPELRIVTQGQPNGFLGDEDDGVAVNITRWEVDGDTLFMTGAITGPAFLVTNPVGGVVDPESGHELDVTFDLTISNP